LIPAAAKASVVNIKDIGPDGSPQAVPDVFGPSHVLMIQDHVCHAHRRVVEPFPRIGSTAQPRRLAYSSAASTFGGIEGLIIVISSQLT
jgi:hypothetical protein